MRNLLRDRAPEQQSGSRARWPVLLPAFVVVVWLLFGALGSGEPGSLTKVQRNDGVSFLPVRDEVTEVARSQERFAGKKIQPALVVFARDDGLTDADRTAILGRATEIGKMTGLAGPVAGPEPSVDGKAARLLVPVPGDDGFVTGERVRAIRDLIATGLPSGLSAHVTGPAGFTADLGAVFDGIDGRLLLITAALVVLILVLVYRSVLLPLVVLLSAGLALITASTVVRVLAEHDLVMLNGQGQGILFILVFGASTDYALLLIARCREELEPGVRWAEALRRAWRASVESIVASAATVVLGLLCLLLSELSSNRGLGPVAAIGIGASLLASLTFLPAALVLLGPAAFWPSKPKPSAGDGRWNRIAGLVGRRFRPVWMVTALGLAALALFAPMLRAGGTSGAEMFLQRPDAVAGQDVLAAHYPGAVDEPAVVLARRDSAASVAHSLSGVDGVTATAVDPREVDGMVQVNVVLAGPAGSAVADDTVPKIRAAAHAVPGAEAKIGGEPAIRLELREAAQRDRMTIIPMVLAVIFCTLALLLRSLLAPLMLIATVVLSFAATLGVGALVFNDVLHLPQADPAVPLYAFVFLVALGIDYNIFLMTRVREETARAGTRQGTLRALAVTGGVITSAGVVLAATFAALCVLPILFMAQIAFLVAFGVLLDTLIVRSLLVPALTLDIGRRVWWPGRLRRVGDG